MNVIHSSAPTPELRIVPIAHIWAHEEHDSQRSKPLEARLREAELFINPPIVAPMEGEGDDYVILDGANRCYAFGSIGFEHILVQVTSYNSGFVFLDSWNHIVSGWGADSLLNAMHAVENAELLDGNHEGALVTLVLRDGRTFSLTSSAENLHERNATLRRAVSTYQQNAALYRTALNEPGQLWPLYPDATALFIFPAYRPADIIRAAKYRAFLPPGISRHVIHGRALHLNYPMDALRDDRASLHEKNEALQIWLRQRLAQRQVRYYAEATYQFNE